MEEHSRELCVGPEESGRRLDLFLAERLALSRSQVRRLLARGAVRLDGRPLGESAKGRTLAAGDALEVEPYRRPEHQQARPEPDAPLSVVAEGDGWLAVDKPAGTPVHPFTEDETGTLLSAVVARHPEIQGVGEGGLRSGVVHRLDVDTSGVMLMATTEERWQGLRRAFEAHRVEKVYHALVAGRLDVEGGAHVGLALARHRPARVRVVDREERARARGVRDCRMTWRPLEVFEAATLVEVRPETGFLHQIRVVLAHRGHPLLGDSAYGGPDAAGAAWRHMLHATRVAVDDVEAGCAPSDDFARLCERLRTGLTW
jgi:23S rRNA pseudouridine1911/1915/1917 synthase